MASAFSITDIEMPTIMALEPIEALWPCVLVVVALTLWRKLIDYSLQNTSEYYARQQITHAKPAWMPDTLAEMDQHPDKLANGSTVHTDLRQRVNTKSSTSSAPKGTAEREFEDICRSKGVSEMFHFFSSRDVALAKKQRRDLKSYHKAVNELELKKEKFLESAYKLTVVSAISCYGFWVVNIEHSLFVNHRKQWPKYPDHEPYRQETDSFLLWYYILSIGYHVQRTITQFHNPSRKDFVALFIHHWSTIVCLLFSYLAAFLRTGSLVMFIHENADIFLESAKISSYCHWIFGKELFFGLFVISWFVMRLWAFSYKVLYEIIRFGSKQLWIGNSPLFFNWTCVILLFILEALHIYWTYFIFVVFRKKWRGGGTTDVRSETDDDSDQDVAGKKQE